MKKSRDYSLAELSSQYQRALDCLNCGRQKDAVSLAEEILAASPDHADACHLLGVVAGQRGQYDDAYEFIGRAIKLNPKRPGYYYSLGHVLTSKGQKDAAITAYKRAVQLNPKFVLALNNLGVVLCSNGLMEEGLAACQQAIYLDPNNADLLNNAGNALSSLGRIQEAEDCYRRALQLRPEYARAHTNLIFLLAAGGESQAGKLTTELRNWDRVQGRVGREHCLPARKHEPTSGRRMRVGYVSPDFRGHAVSYFFEPLLAGHDREHFEVYCYDAGVPEDDTTKVRLRSHADHWRSVNRLSEAELARKIYDDRIDILVDLAGHTMNSRLQAFTYRPAPVQVAYLGFFASTGMAAMDYWVTDAVLHPPDTTEWAVEKIYRLSRCAFSYRPPDEAPGVAPCPNPDNKVIFGSFSNLSKLTPGVVETWGRILRSLPESRLLLMDKPLAEPGPRQRLLQLFKEQCVPAERLLIRPGMVLAKYLECYAEVDIVLDPFPRTGGTTTAEALWMGVPVVTLAGRHYVERISATKLAAVGLEDLITNSREEYISKALELARDPERRITLRAGAREAMSNSPLCDGEGLAREMESAYLSMWARFESG